MASKFLGMDWKVWILVILVVGYFVYTPEQVFVNNLMHGVGGAGGNTPVTPGGGAPANPNSPYTGPVYLNVTDQWAIDQSGLQLLGANYVLYHHDLASVAYSSGTTYSGIKNSNAGAISQVTGDNGVFYLAVEYLTQTTAYIDPSVTMNLNKPFITGYMLRDMDNNGQQDLVFTLDFSTLAPLSAGMSYQIVNLALQIWKYQTTTTPAFTIIGAALTGMTTAGTYTWQYYISGWTAGTYLGGTGYDLKLAKLVLCSISTQGATSCSTNSTMQGLMTGGTLQVTKASLSAVGAQSGKSYGPGTMATSWDAANQMVLMFQANSGGTTDVTQVNYASDLIMERQQPPTSYVLTISFKTASGALTASSLYFLLIYATFDTPAASTFSKYVTITMTG